MKIGLFGGTFDPIHIGHVIAARDALEGAALDRVIVLPAAQAPLREVPTGTAASDRLEMARLAFAEDERFQISDWEIRRGGVSYSVDTAAHFAMLHPADELFWIVGADQFERLGGWREIGRLCELVTFVVLERPGYAVKAPDGLAGLRWLRCPGHWIALSSSELRDRARRGLTLAGFVPHMAVAYLEEKGLYRQNA